MKVSLNWLNTYLDRPIDADEAESVMLELGFPLESAEPTPPEAGDDLLLDFEVTSNRSDCLSHVGIAREITAGSDRTLQPPAITLPETSQPVSELTSVTLDAPDACPTYTARVITGVKVGPSPDWLATRLIAIGLRPVNNIVDITNFVLHELGQPLHAFDLDKLADQQIVVRKAAKGETMTAIDGSKLTLEPHMLVIADADRPQALAGVMGGLDSEVTESTTNLLLESATFDPLVVRRASRGLKIASDSSYRYERGVDPQGLELASQRAAAMIVEIAGGTLAQGVIHAGQPAAEPITLTLRAARCNRLLGTDLSAQQQADLLARLDLNPSVSADGSTIDCIIPTYRLDLVREVDLIEEIARTFGLESIERLDKMAIVVRPPQNTVQAKRTASDLLAAHGYHETMTPSLIATEQALWFIPEPAKDLTLHDERRKAEPTLRPALSPSLLACRKLNQDVGNAPVALFELANTWTVSPEGKPEESLRLGILADVQGDPATALRQTKTALSALCESLMGPDQVSGLSYHPISDKSCDRAGQESSTAGIKHPALGDKPVGRVLIPGQALLDAFDLKSQVILVELRADAWLSQYPPQHTAGQLPRFPAVERDLSVIVSEAVAWADLATAIEQAQPAHCESLDFLTAYRGKPIPKGQKSISLRLRFRKSDATLTGESVDTEMTKVTQALASTGAEIRS